MENKSNLVDKYLSIGCGRCKLVGTPQCKVHNWDNELMLLRQILLKTDLTEDLKWDQPCYTYNGKNILILSAFKEYASISFFKGALLKDDKGLLIKPTENTQSNRQFRFKTTKEIIDLQLTINQYVQEAIDIENSGQKILLKKHEDYSIPVELEEIFQKELNFKEAFYRLTPGRQRGYLIHFSSGKQSKTRLSRILKSMDKIYEGLGFNER